MKNEEQFVMVRLPLTAEQHAELARDKDEIMQFADAMYQKMVVAMTKGKEGWDKCEPSDLSCMLREHVEKGDPVDVANFCMMLHAMGAGISPIPPCADVETVGYGREASFVDLKVPGCHAVSIHKEWEGGIPLVRRTDMEAQAEVPVAREFWIKEHVDGGLSIFLSKEDVEKHNVCLRSTIHVREVLPGDGE